MPTCQPASRAVSSTAQVSIRCVCSACVSARRESNWRQGDRSDFPIALPEEKTMRIPGTTIYITGAAGGLGSAIAIACVKAGAHVALFDRDAQGLAALVKSLRAQPNAGKIVPIVADLSSEEGVQAGI